jgi:hypothetical protein
MRFFFKYIDPRLLGLCAVLLSASFLTVKAQNESSLLSKVDLWFLFLDESEGSFYIKTDGGFELLSGAPYSVTNTRSFLPGTSIEIYKDLRMQVDDTLNSEDEQRQRKAKVADLMVPSNLESALVVLAPVSTGPNGMPIFKERYFEEPLIDSASGSIQLINLGVSRTAAALGTERVVLEPGEVKTIKAPTDSRNRLKVQVADDLDGKWKVIERRVVFLSPGELLTGVFVYSASGMKHSYSRSELLSMGKDPPPCHAWLQFKH